MTWSKIIAVTAIVLFVFGIATINCAEAGEKIKYHGTSYTTDTKQIEVGDVEGHIILINKAKQLYINENTGERSISTSVNTMDINPKMKQFSVRGSGWNADKDGDKVMREFEGKPAGKNHWKGTFKYVSGTGKFKGITGGGTWDSYSMGQGEQSYMEVDAEREIPKQ